VIKVFLVDVDPPNQRFPKSEIRGIMSLSRMISFFYMFENVFLIKEHLLKITINIHLGLVSIVLMLDRKIVHP
jgi:hypothetical protein